MLPLRNQQKDAMLSDRLTLFLMLTIFSVSNANVVFNKPPPGGETVAFPEDTVPGTVLYTLLATDAGGNTPVFSLNVNCMDNSMNYQFFTTNQYDQLLVPPEGLDAENCTRFNFTFNVTAGGSQATSDPLIINVTDVNDKPPQFSKLIYHGEVWKNGEENDTVNGNDPFNVTDQDISSTTITYAIAGAQTTFAINVTSGSVYVKNPLGLAALASPTMLTIQATDGGLMSTATLNITVHDDPCASTPCQNGGTCESIRGKDNYNCICMSGYNGTNCANVDYCFVNYCQNDGNCINLASGYNCSCGSGYGGKNCTEIIPNTTTTTTPTTTITTLITTRTTRTTLTTTSQPKTAASNNITTTKTPNSWLIVGIVLSVANAVAIIGASTYFARKTKNECQCQSKNVTEKDNKNLQISDNVTCTYPRIHIA